MNVLSVAAVRLRSPRLEESRAFFTNTLGMIENGSVDGAVGLRCFGDETHPTLTLGVADRPGVNLLTLHGDSDAEFETPAGHRVRVVTRRAPLPAIAEPAPILNQPAPLRGVGVEPRRLAHVGLVAADPEAEARWWTATLGFSLREVVEDDHGPLLCTLAVTAQACDVMLVRSDTPQAGALHHVAFAVDQRDTLARAALLFAERSIPIEVGLGQHGLAQLTRLYCFEPSGHRIALVHSPLLHTDPSRPAVRWPPEARELALGLWGAPPPDSFFTVST